MTTEPTIEKGWLNKVIKSVREEVADWPEQKKFFCSKDVPEGSILLILPVKFTRYENLMTGEVKEVMEWNPKAAGIITNIKRE